MVNVYRFEKIKEWNISIENYFYRNIFSQFLTYICILFLYLRNYCAYSKYYIVKKAKKLNIIYCVIQKKTCIKLKQNGSLCFWFNLKFLLCRTIVYEKHMNCCSPYKNGWWISKILSLAFKKNLENAKKLVITQWLRSD